MNNSKSRDSYWMRKSITLARRGWGKTSPNPLVGAVIVRDDCQIGAGWHKQSGRAHAEIEALDSVTHSVTGATMYVSLEPCSTRGRTPPCTGAIIQSGIKRVVVAGPDPNPNHTNKGIAALRAQGIDVDVGVERDLAETLNEAFFCWIRFHRPYVVLKLAMTLDGKIATPSGESKWISGPDSRKRVQRLRRWADAILVGAETIRKDNPRLTVRESQRNSKQQPLRLVASKTGDLGVTPHVLTDGAEKAQVIAFNTEKDGRQLLTDLGKRGITSLLVEGGGELAGQLLRLKLIDKTVIFMAPKILGGRGSRSAVAGPNPSSLDDALSVSQLTVGRCGQDYVLTGYLSDVHRLH